MAIRSIVKFPDPLLRTVAEPVTVFDDALAQLATDLLDTMRAAPCVGITGPHIGVLKRVFVLQLSANEEAKTYINPEIVWESQERIRHQEGSVSMPGALEDVERAAKVRLRYQDLSGTVMEEDAEGFRAVCHQHEVDQLDGIFWLQRLSKLKRDRLIKKYEKQNRDR